MSNSSTSDQAGGVQRAVDLLLQTAATRAGAQELPTLLLGFEGLGSYTGCLVSYTGVVISVI